MKKTFSLILILCLISLLVAGCSEGDNSQSNGGSDAAGNPSSEGADATDTPVLDSDGGHGSDSDDFVDLTPDPNVDVDMTVMSSTMIYATVYQLVIDPVGSLQKKLKVKGSFDVFSDYDLGVNYYYIFVADAQACCEQGLELYFPDSYVYPDDFPSNGAEIEIIGTFTSHFDYGVEYYYVAVEEVNILN